MNVEYLTLLFFYLKHSQPSNGKKYIYIDYQSTVFKII